MDTHDYNADIQHLEWERRKLRCLRQANRIWAGIGKVGETILRRDEPFGWRKSTEERKNEQEQQIEHIGRQLSELKAKANEVREKEGELFNCVQCNKPCRMKFGGTIDQNGVVPAGKYCDQCYPDMIQYLNEVEECERTFVGVVRSERIPGYRLVNDTGRIETECAHATLEDAKDELRQQAVEQCANAVTCFWYEKHQESVLKGHSENGNPYYKTEVTYTAEGKALRLEQK